MVIEVSALRPLPTVFLRKVISVVRCISLSCQHISAMALIPKDLDDAVCCPLDVSKIRFPLKSNECIRNLLRGVSVEIHIECQLYSRGLFWVNDQIPLTVMAVSKQLWRERNAIV